MGIYENTDYEVKELSYDEVMRIIDRQERERSKQDCQENKETDQSLIQKIKMEANAELAPWLTANK